MNTRTTVGVSMSDEFVIAVIMGHFNWVGDIQVFLTLFSLPPLLPLTSFPPPPPSHPPGLRGALKVLRLQALWLVLRTTSTSPSSRPVLPCLCSSLPTTRLLLPTTPQPTSTPLPLQRPWNTEPTLPQAPYTQKSQVQYNLPCCYIYTHSRF